MNYLIQNFNTINQNIFLIPRTKTIFLFLNLNKFFFFAKNNNNFFFIKKNYYLHVTYFQFFYKYFFNKQINIFFKKNNLNLIGFYENNLFKSFVYWNYKLFIFFLSKKIRNSYEIFKVNKNFFYNLYFLSIKILNVKTNKKYYQNVFFFLMKINSFLWFQHNNFLKFYLNFLFANKNLLIYTHFSSYFLHIYSV